MAEDIPIFILLLRPLKATLWWGYQKATKSGQNLAKKAKKRSLMKVEMTQLYLCEEPYWSKYDQSDLSDHPLEINVISDGKYFPGKMWTGQI